MKLYINIDIMKNLRRKNVIYKKLEKSIVTKKLNNENLDLFLLAHKINKSEFYSLFPKRIISLCYFHFDKIYLNSKKKVEKKILSENSVSKKVSILLLEFIQGFTEKKDLSNFFLDYSLFKPLLLSKVVYKVSSNIWYDVGDISTDMNYYSKRLILFNILRNSLFYWRKSENLQQTLVFGEKQISFFGKLGKFKYNARNFFKSKFCFNSI